MSQAEIQNFASESAENTEIEPGDTITVSYTRAWENPPAHWDDNPSKTLEVESVSRSGVIQTTPEDDQYYRIYPGGELWVQPVDGRRVRIPHGKNATVTTED